MGPARMTHSHRWALSHLREVRTVHNMAPASSAELKKNLDSVLLAGDLLCAVKTSRRLLKAHLRE